MAVRAPNPSKRPPQEGLLKRILPTTGEFIVHLMATALVALFFQIGSKIASQAGEPVLSAITIGLLVAGIAIAILYRFRKQILSKPHFAFAILVVVAISGSSAQVMHYSTGVGSHNVMTLTAAEQVIRSCCAEKKTSDDFRSILQYYWKKLPAGRNIEITVLTEDGQHLQAVDGGVCGLDTTLFSQRKFSLNRSTCGQAFRTGQIVRIDDTNALQNDEEFERFNDGLNDPMSLVCVPIVALHAQSGDASLDFAGVVSITATETNAIDDTDVHVAEELADIFSFVFADRILHSSEDACGCSSISNNKSSSSLVSKDTCRCQSALRDDKQAVVVPVMNSANLSQGNAAPAKDQNAASEKSTKKKSERRKKKQQSNQPQSSLEADRFRNI